MSNFSIDRAGPPTPRKMTFAELVKLRASHQKEIEPATRAAEARGLSNKEIDAAGDAPYRDMVKAEKEALATPIKTPGDLLAACSLLEAFAQSEMDPDAKKLCELIRDYAISTGEDRAPNLSTFNAALAEFESAWAALNEPGEVSDAMSLRMERARDAMMMADAPHIWGVLRKLGVLSGMLEEDNLMGHPHHSLAFAYIGAIKADLLSLHSRDCAQRLQAATS